MHPHYGVSGERTNITGATWCRRQTGRSLKIDIHVPSEGGSEDSSGSQESKRNDAADTA